MILVRQTGVFVFCAERLEIFQAFEPKPLPPDPPIIFDEELHDLIEKANRAIGKLDGIMSLISSKFLFTSFYLKKEALLSSQIEGNQTSFYDLLASENDEPQYISKDIRQILNYVTALQHSISILQGKAKFEADNSEPKFTLKILADLHGILLESNKEKVDQIGKFRESQNWVGGKRPSEATFVPPQWEKVIPSLESLVDFLNDIPSSTPTLVKTALMHAQFETIHPFNSGNGRIGRLLIMLLLCTEQALSTPVLYLSLYLKNNRDEYFERLQKIRHEGDWEGWLKFFFKGVFEISEKTTKDIKEILEVFATDQKRIKSLQQAKTPLRIHEFLQNSPIVSIKRLSKSLDLSVPSITSGLQQLEKLGIVIETTGNSRNRLFAYQRYVNLLSN